MIKSLHKFSVLILPILCFNSVNTINAQYSIVTKAQQYYNFDGSKVGIAPDIKISPSDATAITDAKVSIGLSFQSGDILSYNGILPSDVSQSYDATIGTLTFTGTQSAAQWAAILKNVQFSNIAGSTEIADRKITFTLANAVLSTNGHFYKFIKGTGTDDFISWSDANTAANNTKFNGLQGYLATITSQTENNLIVNELQGNGWLGGTDDYLYLNQYIGTTYTGYGNAYGDLGEPKPSVGNFYWVTGPEKGTQFYQRLTTYNNGLFAPITGQYSNFVSGEPNDAGSNGEYYLEIYSKNQDGGYGTPGKWNDWDANTSNKAFINGYVIEFGGMPNDPNTDFYALGTVTLTNTITTPVTFKSFKAIKESKGILLNWSTATETNSKTFEIERSLDATNWNTLYTLNAAGNSNRLLDYSYTDDTPSSDVNYYRIKEIDLDGKYMYSTTISINYSAISNSDVTIYPNPVARGNNITIQLNSTSSYPAVLKLIDMTGRNLLSKNVSIANGQNNISLPINYPSGMYIIQISTQKATNILAKKILIR